MAKTTTGGSTNGRAEPPDPESYYQDKGGRNDRTADRLVEQTVKLVHDLREWIELRIRLAKMEFLEELARKVGNLIIAGTAGLLGVIFLLLSLAIWIGHWLGHSGWGFLIVAGVLFIIAAFFAAVKPRLYKAKYKLRQPAEKEKSAVPETGIKT